MSEFTTSVEFEERYKTLHATYKTGRTKSIQWRKWQLKQLYWLLEDNEKALADALKQDLNRHEFEAICLEIVGIKSDILDSLKNCERWARGEAPEQAGFVMGRLGKSWLRKEPLGVVLIIGAWNFPIYTLLSPAVAAITAGNCVVLKPSELAASCQNMMSALIPKYLDASAISVCTGGPKETSLMLEHKFNHIFYTGGSKVGRIIATAAAKHLTPVVLELGGQAPAIVTKSANLDVSAKRIAHAKLTNAGQICINVNHIFADPAIHDELAARITYWMKEFLRHGRDQVGHIISDNHFLRVTNLLSKTKGTIVYTGDDNSSTKFVHPSVITDVKTSDSLLSEELFCPFVPIIKADIATAIDHITSLPHPLALYIFSNDQNEIDHILNNTTSGGVTINDIMIHSAVPSAPFGGVGESGYGAFHGKYGFEAFSHTRTIVTMPSYLELLLSQRYRPLKLENRSFFEGRLPKVDFKRGESLQDQGVGGGYGQVVKTVGMGFAVIAAAMVGDYLIGNRLGFVPRARELLVSFRST